MNTNFSGLIEKAVLCVNEVKNKIERNISYIVKVPCNSLLFSHFVF